MLPIYLRRWLVVMVTTLLLPALLWPDPARAECSPDQTLEDNDQGEPEDVDGIVGITEAGTTVICIGTETRQVTTALDPDDPATGPASINVIVAAGATVSGSDFVPILLNGDINTISNGGTVTANGNALFAMAIVGAGAVVTNTGTATVSGTDSSALGAEGTGASASSSGTITVTGSNVGGIEVAGSSVNATNSGTLTINGSVGAGITGSGNSPTLNNAGTIQMNAERSVAMGALGNGANVFNSNNIRTDADTALGIGAIGQSLTIRNEGGAEIRTVQAGSHGMYMGLQNIPPLDILIPPEVRDPSAGTLTNAGTIVTTGDDAQGIHGLTNGGTVNNPGIITTQGTDARGINILGVLTSLTNTGGISTTGSGGTAIRITGGIASLINGNSAAPTDTQGIILTDGASAIGIQVNGTVTDGKNAGVIRTTGSGAQGVRLTGGGSRFENLLEITTGGSLAQGMRAENDQASLTELINSGSVKTTGDNADGMFANSSGDGTLSLTNLGTITANGQSSAAMTGVGNRITLVNGAEDGTAPDAQLNALSLTASSMRGMALEASNSLVQNFGTVTVNAAPGTSVDDASYGIYVVGTGIRNDEGRIVVGGQTIEGVSANRVENNGMVESNSGFGFSVGLATSGVTLINSEPGRLPNGILLTDGDSLIENDGKIGGIVENNQTLGIDEGGGLGITNNEGAEITAGASGFGIDLELFTAFIENSGDIDGVRIQTGGGTLVNRGNISDDAPDGGAILMNSIGSDDPKDVSIQNFGMITGATGVGSISGAKLNVFNAGMISAAGAGQTAISGQGSGNGSTVEIINEGQINTTNGAQGIDSFISTPTLRERLRVENRSTGSITTSGKSATAITVIGPVVEDDNLDRAIVINDGNIETTGAGAHGVLGALGLDLTNRGQIKTNDADASAVIYGEPEDTSGIFLTAGLRLVNEGTITSPGIAILSSFSDDEIDNRGTINGDVNLRALDPTITNRFITRAGSRVNGEVSGLGLRDTLMIDYNTKAAVDTTPFKNFELLDKRGNGIAQFGDVFSVNETIVRTGGFELLPGANLISPEVMVSAGAAIFGSNSTVTGDITGNGLIQPGLSPGRLTVDGNVDWAGGLVLEINGTESSAYDVLAVTGELILQDDASVQLQFGGGFAPSEGDTFTLVEAGALLANFDAVGVSVSGLQPGFEFDFSLVGGDLTLIALNDATPVPLPPALLLFGAALTGLACLRRRATAGH